MSSLARLDLSGRRSKKALSNLIAYVLLITITVSLSVLVYGWLKFYVEDDDVVVCPDGVGIVIERYDCVLGDKKLNISLKNKGLFNIDGFMLRVNNRSGAEFGVYLLEDVREVLPPGERYVKEYSFPDGMEDITLVDVQPFLLKDGKVSCRTYASQKVLCS